MILKIQSNKLIITQQNQLLKIYQMYNSYLANKRELEKKVVKERQKTLQNWVNKYYKDVQPVLLENYDKRINTFIRKMEEHPIKLHMEQLQASNLNKLFRNVYQKQSFIGDQSFKFRDKEDWQSLLTPMQRVQRKNNKKLFEQKFGNSDLAFRSIGSQSEYKSITKNNFRNRDKSKQINPPMKYTYKQVNLNNSLNLKTKRKDSQNNEQRASEVSSGNNYRKRTMTNNSGTHFGEDDVRSDAMSHMQKSNGTEGDDEGALLHDLDNEKDDHKMHFKKMVDLEQRITDNKTKKGLKNLLVKCGVYRTKDKRVFSQIETDEFQQKINI